METKVCTKCGEQKEVSFFSKKLTKYTPWCKQCIKENRIAVPQKTHVLDINATKACVKCNQVKRGEEFLKNKHMKNGLSNWCKACGLLYQKLRKYNGNIPNTYCIDCSHEIKGKNQNVKRCYECSKINRNNISKLKNAKAALENPNIYKERYAKYRDAENKRRSEKYHTDPTYRAKKKAWNESARKEGYFRKWYIKNVDKERARNIKWRSENKEKANEMIKAYRIKNKDKLRLKDKLDIQKLTDNRVACAIRGMTFKGIRLADLPPEIIEAKRTIILIKREIKKQEQ